jgi:thiamine biosynthesis lipoprotein
MEVSITAFGPDDAVERAVTAAFERIAALEQVLSDWRPRSELNHAVERAVSACQPIGPDLEAVLLLARSVAAGTHGAFDPTIGAVTRLWREERRTGRAAPPHLVTAARHTVGWQGLEIDAIAHCLRLRTPGTRIDLGGIAKGWILDQARQRLAAHGITQVLLEAGGDLVAGDAPPGRAGWRVMVSTAAGDSVAMIRNGAMATSGPTAQWVTDSTGRRRSHVIDPRTGLGLDTGAEVTVMAADGAIADALATALTVMPRTAWQAVLERFDAQLVAVTRDE